MISSVLARPGTPVIRQWPPAKNAHQHLLDHLVLADDDPADLLEDLLLALLELLDHLGGLLRRALDRSCRLTIVRFLTKYEFRKSEFEPSSELPSVQFRSASPVRLLDPLAWSSRSARNLHPSPQPYAAAPAWSRPAARSRPRPSPCPRRRGSSARCGAAAPAPAPPGCPPARRSSGRSWPRRLLAPRAMYWLARRPAPQATYSFTKSGAVAFSGRLERHQVHDVLHQRPAAPAPSGSGPGRPAGPPCSSAA